MRKLLILAVLSAMLIGHASPASAEGVIPNPVVNGDFELHVPAAVGSQLEGTALDECVGIGHQAYYGSETVQADLIDRNDPAAAVERLAADPQGEAEFTAGYGHCVWSTEDGYDLAWLNAVNTAQRPAVHWSNDLVPSVAFGDNDADGDREAIIAGDGTGSGHNMWQAYPSPHQAFTANFNALEFDVEAGAINPGALVQISLSATPLEAQTDRVVTALDCGLNFRGRDLLNHMDEDGHVAMSPTDAAIFSRHASCADAVADFQAAAADGDTDAQRAVLGRLRIVQVSFWSFNGAAADEDCGCAIQIDNVALSNATTVAEEVVLNQNLNLG